MCVEVTLLYWSSFGSALFWRCAALRSFLSSDPLLSLLLLSLLALPVACSLPPPHHTLSQMSALITVGSTSFTPLIHSILLPSSLSSLQFLGITNLLVQAGNSALPEGWELGIKKKVGGGGGGGLEVEVIGFSEGLEELVGGMQVVVCHAGALRCVVA